MLTEWISCYYIWIDPKSFFVFQVVTNKTQNSPKAKPKTIQPTTTSTTSSEAVQLRRGQQSRTSANNKKKCRVLFSYQPKHDDELKLGTYEVWIIILKFVVTKLGKMSDFWSFLCQIFYRTSGCFWNMTGAPPTVTNLNFIIPWRASENNII